MSATSTTGNQTLGRRALTLTVASFTANLLAYAMSLVLSRGLGPSTYGAMAAILALAVIGTIPSQSEQFLAARTALPDHFTRPRTIRAWTVGLLLATFCVAASAPLGTALDLPGRYDLAWLGLILLPLTVVGAHLGTLLGSRRTLAFGALLVALSGGRLLAAAVTFAIGGGTSQFLALAAVATWLTLAGAWLSTRRGPRGLSTAPWRELLPAVSALAAVYLVTATDVIGARLLLPAHDSGDYAVAGLFSRIAFWGPYAIVLVVFPMAARGEGGRRLLAGALGITAAAGSLLALGAWTLAGPFIRATSGQAYGAAAGLAPAMALLGTVGACLQLLLMHALARRSRRVELAVWTGLVAEILLLTVLRPVGAAGIIAIAGGAQLVTAVAAGASEWSRTPWRDSA